MIGDDATTDPRPRFRAREFVDFAEAAGVLLVAALAIAVLPFRRLTRTIRRPSRAENAPAERNHAVHMVTRAVDRAARRIPLRIVCLHKALATHWMLRRRGVATRVHYGISPGGETLKAHVWVDADGAIIMGEEESMGFARVATFPVEVTDGITSG